MRFQKVLPNGVTVTTCRPFAKPTLVDRNPVVYCLFQWRRMLPRLRLLTPVPTY